MPPQQSTLHMFLLGGFGLLSISALCYYMFWYKPGGLPAIKDAKPAAIPKDTKPAEPVTRKEAAKSTDELDVVVEDADSDEEEEEEDDDEDPQEAAAKAELEELKSKYEDANRLAQKYISGQAYSKAVEKLSEALDIAPKLPSARRDLITLYNNRSAMYEKLEMHDKSLADIAVVLTMEPNHMKARVRRARIYDAQGKFQLALDDYIYANLLQQIKNEPPANQPRAEAIVKELAKRGADGLFKSMRATAGTRPLPSKSHCKNFLESYPSAHLWGPHYRAQDRATLEAAYKAAQEAEQTPATPEEAAEIAERSLTFTAITSTTDPHLVARQRALDLICFDLVHNRFSDAFALLAALPQPENNPTGCEALEPTLPLMFLSPFEEAFATNSEVLLSLQYELIGTEKHLRCDLTGAAEAYARALRYYPNNIDARIKLANAHLEVPDLKAAGKVLAELMAHFEVLDKQNEVVAIMTAWTVLHRVSMYVTRDDKGEYSPTAIKDAQADVDLALTLTEAVKGSPAGRAVAVTALMRAMHVIMQSKPMIGEAPAEDDTERCKGYLARAKAINPDSESVMLIEAEILNNDGEVDEALEVVEKVRRRPEAIPGDCTYFCLRASILVNKAVTLMQMGQGMDRVQEAFSEASALYIQGLAMEPNAIELLNQYAQFCSMVGDVPKAIEMLKASLPLARTRDDVQDLSQLLIMNETQLKVIELFKKTQG